ncbi:HEPN domain-containing protein [Vulcanisaeta sp. JCM 16161]|uniref:HEPN domain-containing protein n=1 Tax=Vulcanisaeta sp. JCM 16161 TaxID=1295372 RepID=UPI00406BE780
MAKSHINQAIERIKHAREAINGGNYPYVVRQCQEAVELLLKAALRIVGVEPPRWHDVGPVLRRERNKFPVWFQEYIDELASISRSLRKEREFSMYGDEESGIPPEELYTRIDAEKALNDAERVLSLVSKLFSEVSRL